MDTTKYAQLLADYCLDLRDGQKLLVQSTYLAEPLLRALYIEACKRGCWMEVITDFRSKGQLFYSYATESLLNTHSPFKMMAMESFDAYLYIRAPYNLREESGIDPVKATKGSQANKEISRLYNERTASGSLRRSLCQYPTEAAAQQAGMSLDDYEDFVSNACKLKEEDPAAAWRQLGLEQQNIVDRLHLAQQIRYRNSRTDVRFSVEGRTWINSDGKTNMPSGEVFTGPIENSVQGVVHFDYPSIYRGVEVSGVTLEIKDGAVIKWQAERGQNMLDEVMQIPGARYFGEVAIGTNYGITRATGNILFDEKIGGTIHMALGQSYRQTGGKNESSLHWDLIAGMQDGGEIWADDELIYQDGRFRQLSIN